MLFFPEKEKRKFTHLMEPSALARSPTSTGSVTAECSQIFFGAEHVVCEKSNSFCAAEFLILFKEIKIAVFLKKPFWREILKKGGEKKLYDYEKDYIDVNPNPPIQRRQDDFIATFTVHVAEKLGQKIAES